MNPVRNTHGTGKKRVVSNGVKPFVVKPISHLEGKISLPGDKSIAHRSIILSSLSKGKTEIKNFPINKDCLSTVLAFQKLGIKINLSVEVSVFGKGRYGLKKPKKPIFVGESGATLRLLLGVLAGQYFKTKLMAGKSLSKRPMLRVTAPLRLMGAKIKSNITSQVGLASGGKYQKSPPKAGPPSAEKKEEYPPIIIEGGDLKPIFYRMPVASAQVKSAILLAALFTKGETRILEPVPTRDHTERMLKLFKADIKVNHPPSLKLRGVVLRSLGKRGQNNIVITGNKELVSPGKITLPGDISSAAFFMVLAAIIPNSKVQIRGISLNPSRIGVIRVLKRMKANIRVSVSRTRFSRFEPMGNIFIKNSSLKATKVKKEEIPSLIDELPILMVAGCFAKGKTVFEGVSELRVKETDRINSMVSNLRSMGADITVSKINSLENIIIKGAKGLEGTKVRSFQDHRTAMSMIVAGLAAKGKTYLDDISGIDKSFPNFLSLLKTLI